MPELPEVETVRRDVDAVLVGRTVERVVLGRLRSIRRAPSPEAFVGALVGRRVASTGRHGKYLLIRLDVPLGDDISVLVVHLRMSGQLLHERVGEPCLAHTHVRLVLDDGFELRFVDPRTFGEMFLTSSDLPELSALGPDALSSTVTDLRVGARGRSVALKSFLLDQRVVAGVGSIYADEILFRSGLRPGRSVARVSGPQFGRVYENMIAVLHEAIGARGSTLGDGQYVGLDGSPGTFALRHRVHARVGQACFVCGAAVRRSIVGQRSAYWCPTCQS